MLFFIILFYFEVSLSQCNWRTT